MGSKAWLNRRVGNVKRVVKGRKRIMKEGIKKVVPP